MNITHYNYDLATPPGFMWDGGHAIKFESEQEKWSPSIGWTGDSYVYQYCRARWKPHGRGPGLHAARPIMAKKNSRRNKNRNVFVDPLLGDLNDSIIKLQGIWHEKTPYNPSESTYPKLRVVGNIVHCSYHKRIEGSTLHMNSETGNVEFTIKTYNDGPLYNIPTPSSKFVVKFDKKNTIKLELFKSNNPTVLYSSYTLNRAKKDDLKSKIDPVLSSIAHLYNPTKDRQMDIRYCMEIPAGKYYVCAATGDPMFSSEHDLYVDNKELLPSFEKFEKIEKNKIQIKKKSEILKVNVSVPKIHTEFLNTCRTLSKKDYVFTSSNTDSKEETTKTDEDEDPVRARYVDYKNVDVNCRYPDEKKLQGVFAFLGRKGDSTNKFVCPSFDGNVKLRHSKTYSTSYPLHAILDGNDAKTFMDGIYDGSAWVSVDLGETRSLVLDSFAISMKNRWQYPMVNFKIQGSNDWEDPDQWETLSIHKFDNSMSNKFQVQSRAIWNVGTVQSPMIYEGPPIVSSWLTREKNHADWIRKVMDMFPGISRRATESIGTRNYVNTTYFANQYSKTFHKKEIIITMKRQSASSYCGFYTSQRGQWGCILYSASTVALKAGCYNGMRITHVLDGSPLIVKGCKVVYDGKIEGIVEELIYPPKPKTDKKIAYKWQWEDGTKGSGQWKNYIPKDDTAIEQLYKAKGKSVTLNNSWGKYIIDLTYQGSGNVTGTQKKVSSGWVRPIRRVPKTGAVPAAPPKPTHAKIKFTNSGKVEQVPYSSLKAKTRRVQIKNKTDWDKYEAKKPMDINFVCQDPAKDLLVRLKMHKEEMIEFFKSKTYKNSNFSTRLQQEAYHMFGAYPNKNWAKVGKDDEGRPHYAYAYDRNLEWKKFLDEEAELKLIERFSNRVKEFEPKRDLKKSQELGLIMSRKFTSTMNKKKAYRYFRIKQTGRNGYAASLSNYLYLGYWELFGELRGEKWGRVNNQLVKTLNIGETKFSGDVFRVRSTVPSRFHLVLPPHRQVSVTRATTSDPWGFTIDTYGRVSAVTDLSLEAKGIMSLQCVSYAYNQITRCNGVEIRREKDFKTQADHKKIIDRLTANKTTCKYIVELEKEVR